jgi:phosphoglycolate phosphatase
MTKIFENYTIAFDLDGTLVDTAPDLVRATNEIMDEIGLPHCVLDDMRKIVGRGARAAVLTAASLHGRQLSDDELAIYLPKFLASYESGIADRSKVYDGAHDCLKLLRENGANLVVCTNKPTHLAKKVLSELGIIDDFQAIYGPESTPKIKPDPLHLTTAILGIGGNLARAILVGDSENDVIAAQEANVPVIVTSFGYTTKKASDLGADAFFDHYDELFELLVGFIKPT